MSFESIAKKRYSVRKYTDKKVEKEKLDKILNAALIAPTSANRQPQRLVVVQSAEGLEKLGKSAKIFNAPLVIIVCGDHSDVWTRPIDNKNMIDVDTTIVTDHMMLQATELGLGTLWVSYINPKILRSDFGIPENFEPVNLLVIGYSADEKPELENKHELTRKKLEEIVFFEKMGK